MRNEGKWPDRGSVWTRSQEMIHYWQEEVGRLFLEWRSFMECVFMWIESPSTPEAQPQNLGFFIGSSFPLPPHIHYEQALTELPPKYILTPLMSFLSSLLPIMVRSVAFYLDYSHGIGAGLLSWLSSLHNTFCTQRSVSVVFLACIRSATFQWLPTAPRIEEKTKSIFLNMIFGAFARLLTLFHANSDP